MQAVKHGQCTARVTRNEMKRTIGLELTLYAALIARWVVHRGIS